MPSLELYSQIRGLLTKYFISEISLYVCVMMIMIEKKNHYIKRKTSIFAVVFSIIRIYVFGRTFP